MRKWPKTAGADMWLRMELKREMMLACGAAGDGGQMLSVSQLVRQGKLFV